MKYLGLLAAGFLIFGCSQPNDKNRDSLPAKSEKQWKASNPVQELGYHLYFEKRFSADNSISCNTCHNILNRGNGAQDTPVATGINGLKGGRNSPTVWNATFLSSQFWDGRAKDLAEQAKGPIVNPVEMGMKDHDMAIEKIKGISGYQDLFSKAFPGEKDPMTIDNAAKAIAAFEDQLTTLNSPFDKGTMSTLAKEGYEEFKTVGCTSCHSGDHFAGPQLPTGTPFLMKFPTFPDAELEKKYHFSKDPGRFEVTKNEADKNMWRVPTLRNVAITAPYFHNGSVSDLSTAVRIMAKTQLNRELSDQQATAITEFLNSLTGERPLIQEPEALANH